MEKHSESKFIPSFPNKSEYGPSLLRYAKPMFLPEDLLGVDAKLLGKPPEDGRKTEKVLEHYLKHRRKIKAEGSKEGVILRQVCLEETSHVPTNAVLEKIHSPRRYEQRGQKCLQPISNDCTTRTDVIALKHTLDERLKECTDQFGLNRKRRELFSQCMDEIIREVSMTCVERGQLLLAVRDELYKTFDSYESLFCSGIAYGISRQMRIHKHIDDWREKIHDLKEKIEDLEEMEASLNPAFSQVSDKYEGQMDIDDKQYLEEFDRLTKNHEQLKEYLLTAVQDPFANEPAAT